MGLSTDQISYEFACRVLRSVLRAAVGSEPGAVDGIGSVPCRASATLYMLLMDHPVDRRGRCRSCRHPGGVFGLPRHQCRVRSVASLWLKQPAEFLHSLLAYELGLTELPPPTRADGADRAATGGRSALDGWPRIGPDPTDPCIPAISDPGRPAPASSPKVPWAGRPDPVHGGAGVHSDAGLRSRRVPPGNPRRDAGGSLVFTAGMP
jgi:hypothetical protein